MNEKKISVIVPTYNAEETIERCIVEIFRGGYRNIEIIVVNDGSTDRTEEIVQKLSRQDDRIKLISQDNQGVAVARNTGLKHASGDYIAWCDADDWYEPDCLELLCEFLESYDADIALCRSQIPGRQDVYDSSEVQVWDRDGAIEAFLEDKLLNGVLWNKLIRRELFDGIEFDPSLRFWEDLDVMWRVLQRVSKVVRFNQAKYNYSVSPETLTAKRYSHERFCSSWKVWDRVVEDCHKPGSEQFLQKAVQRRYLWLYGDLRLMLKDHYDRDDDKEMIQSLMRKEGIRGLSYLPGLLNRTYAIVCMISLPLAETACRFIYKEKAATYEEGNYQTD